MYGSASMTAIPLKTLEALIVYSIESDNKLIREGSRTHGRVPRITHELRVVECNDGRGDDVCTVGGRYEHTSRDVRSNTYPDGKKTVAGDVELESHP